MADQSAIEWTEATWNPMVGCSIVSPGCTNCYAMGAAARQIRCAKGIGRATHYEGTVQESKAGPVWTGQVVQAPEHILLAPLRRRKPATYFVNSMSDLFHPAVPDELILRVLDVIRCASYDGGSNIGKIGGGNGEHTFQCLTKRSARMRSVMNRLRWDGEKLLLADDGKAGRVLLRNLWLGVSTEDQQRADERIPDLLATPAACRFISAEPLLGPIDLRPWLRGDDGCEGCDDGVMGAGNRCGRRDIPRGEQCPRNFEVFEFDEGPVDADGAPQWIHERRVTLDWIIAGGESGRGARPMHPDWARSLRDQCAAAGVPFFFKQWGSWATFYDRNLQDPDWRNCPALGKGERYLNLAGGHGFYGDRVVAVRNVRKKIAGRLLDGVEHNELPQVKQ